MTVPWSGLDDRRLSRIACWALLLGSLALVLWIRLLPQSLHAADDRADTRARSLVRERVIGEVPRDVPPAQRSARADELVARWIAEHRAQFEAEKAGIAGRLRSDWSYTGADGRERAYLGDFDSYLWLRHARTYLRTGTPCDAVVDGACRDTFTSAPVGARTAYARSLHVAAIAGLHRLITSVRPDFPLPASAFLVPVIAGVLGALPAFFIARALAGTVAGPFAAVITALHPVVLTRSIGSDNDVWNVVWPLSMAWAVVAALAAERPRRRVLYAVLAGACAGLQAWTWRGWLFSYLVVIAGLAGAGALSCARHAVRQRTWRVWESPEVRRAALVLAIFYVAAGVATTLAGAEDRYLTIPAKAVATVLGVGADGPDRSEAIVSWPSALTRVAEIRPLGWWAVARASGSVLVFTGGLVGLLLLLLPRDRWRWPHRVLFIGGLVLYGASLVAIEPSRTVTMLLLGAPLGVALIGRWWLDERDDVHLGAAVLVVVWFLAAVYATHDGHRFLLLLAPPLGIAFAVVAGRLHDWVGRGVRGTPAWYRATVYAVLAVVLALTLAHPLRWGYSTARGYAPSMHDAWWDALTRLRDTAGPGAIVHAWWDYGHWITYVAERPVSNDGSSLLTHIPYWVSRALVTPSEAESAGVLRMLSCGSDATPSPEAARGAYGKLRGTGRDPVTAHGILTSLVALDAGAAESDLQGRGFSASQRAEILRSTHCDPPEAYLVLTSGLVAKRQTWMAFGLWDPRRERGAGTPAPGDHWPFVAQWLPCRQSSEDPGMVCEIQAIVGNRYLAAFAYDAGVPGDARLRRRGGEERALSEGTPGVVMVAGEREIREVPFASPTDPDLGVLLDVPRRRILVGAPAVLRSTFVHLMYLDGRYARRYEKVDDRTDLGERVVTWKIRWNGR